MNEYMLLILFLGDELVVSVLCFYFFIFYFCVDCM